MRNGSVAPPLAALPTHSSQSSVLEPPPTFPACAPPCTSVLFLCARSSPQRTARVFFVPVCPSQYSLPLPHPYLCDASSTAVTPHPHPPRSMRQPTALLSLTFPLTLAPLHAPLTVPLCLGSLGHPLAYDPLPAVHLSIQTPSLLRTVFGHSASLHAPTPPRRTRALPPTPHRQPRTDSAHPACQHANLVLLYSCFTPDLSLPRSHVRLPLQPLSTLLTACVSTAQQSRGRVEVQGTQATERGAWRRVREAGCPIHAAPRLGSD